MLRLQILIMLVLILVSLDVRAQSMSDKSNNSIVVGSEKVVNTHRFNQRADLDFRLPFGILLFKNSYQGTGTTVSNSYFRDEWRSGLKFYYPITDSLYLSLNQNTTLFSDTRSALANEFSRVNGLAGLRYNYRKNSFIELSAGAEDNNQMGIKSGGKIFKGLAKLDQYRIEDFRLSSDWNAEYLGLNDDRVNSNSDFSVNLMREYNSENTLRLNFGYINMNRDFMSFMPGAVGLRQIETREEDRLKGGMNIRFSLSDNFFGKADLSIDKTGTERFFQESTEGIANSAVSRKLDQFRLALNTEAQYKGDKLRGLIGMRYNSSSERNHLSRKFDILDYKFDEIKANEQKQDRISSRTQVYSNVDWEIGRADRLRVNSSISIFSYDTPSKENNDERDELSMKFNARYAHKFSSILTGSLSFNAEMLHLVFLKAQHSALNNTNRIFGLRPEINIKTDNWTMNPRIELLANYTVYDFEGISPGVQSFSLRQLSYRDSVCVLLGKMFNLQGSLKLRYSERGILYWNSFSESPQTRSYDNFVRFLLFANVSSKLTVGSGIRYYSLAQESIAIGAGGDYHQNSYGPETVVTISFSSGSSVSLRGWYEFQTIDDRERKQIPNLILYTRIRL